MASDSSIKPTIEVDSPTSVESDTVVDDSGLDRATSISSVTTISSENLSSINRETQCPPTPPSTKRDYRNNSSKPLTPDCTSLLEKNDARSLEASQLPNEENPRQNSTVRSIVRLLDIEEFEESSSGYGSSEEEAVEEDVSGEISTDDDSCIEIHPQAKTTKQGIPVTIRNERVGELILESQQQNRLQAHGGFQRMECVSIPPLLIPKSQYGGWKHPLPVSDEKAALRRLMKAENDKDELTPPFHEVLLEDFVIYRPGQRTRYPWQMVTLDNITSNHEACTYLVDGVLKRGGILQRVEAMEIDIDAISIDGLEDKEIHSVQNLIYLQTLVCARQKHRPVECWYRLGKPAEQYQDLFRKFLWVADLAKHVIDYLYWRYSLNGNASKICLRDFQQDFAVQLMEWHAEDVQFQQWMHLYGRSDFRIPINRHREFLFSRAFNLGGHYTKHDLWSDLMVRRTRSIIKSGDLPEDTLVTPYVKHCCRAMPWSYALVSKSMADSVQLDQERRAAHLGFPHPETFRNMSEMAENVSGTAALLEKTATSRPSASIKPAEVLGKFAIIRTWRSNGSTKVEEFTYAYIQGIVNKGKRTELRVIFIYLPSETICLDGYYPHGDELFLSDDCNCTASGTSICLTDILRLVVVHIGDDRRGPNEFFIRQKYIHAEDAICQLKDSDFKCTCRRQPVSTNTDREKNERQTEPRNKPLPGLSLFAGCGNFDFGLEAFGAVDFIAAVEIEEVALKTYAANRSLGHHGLIHDSVNPSLFKILKGHADPPGVGAIGFISAGSPCVGFSRINTQRFNDRGLRNCSLVASTVSYIETFLPNYAVMENVGAMGSGVGNSCNQVIACLVGLGYQVRKMTLNSQLAGSSQSRDRLFIVAAAPRLPLPRRPENSHNPATGLPKASAVSEGLPCVDNDDMICISHPDHIAGAKQTPRFRELIRRVPRYPKKMSFVKSVKELCQGQAQLEWARSRKSIYKVKKHMAFTRLDPDSSIPTITTSASPTCAFGGGRIIHWDQHRTLTVLEARRAQGIPDEEVIIGDAPQQWAQIGNAVDRKVAVALGKVIADSWFSSKTAVEMEPLVKKDPDPIMLTAADNNDEEDTIVVDHGVDINSREITRERGERVRSDMNRDLEILEKPGSRTLEAIKIGGSDTIWPDTKKIDRAEANFIKLFQPQHDETDSMNPAGGEPSDLRFSQIQRRETTTIEQSPNGTQTKSVQMTAERSIEFRTGSPALSSSSSSSSSPASGTKTPWGSAEHPIEVDTEIAVSKRRKRGDSAESDDDNEIQKWVGKRIRSRFGERKDSSLRKAMEEEFD